MVKITTVFNILILAFSSVGLTSLMASEKLAFSWIDANATDRLEKISVAAAGNNIYIVWSTDKNTSNSNDELIFRTSTDGGKTFGDKINLSNTNDTDSIDPMIDTYENEQVIITWWERNGTYNEPVAKVSSDHGITFGPVLNLADNGPIGR
ncbi:MAG: hypothetical protein M3Y25_04370 [Thermoproteota archaeon]|nr:hypothetical protein [Thermoproteota archaeon]